MFGAIVFAELWQDVTAAVAVAIGSGFGVLAGKWLFARLGQAVRLLSSNAQSAVIEGVSARMETKYGAQINGTYELINNGRLERIAAEVTDTQQRLERGDQRFDVIDHQLDDIKGNVGGHTEALARFEGKLDGVLAAVRRHN